MRNSKWMLLAAALLIFAVAPACTGFFVNPTLSTLAIGPQNQTITANPLQTLQMTATGTYSDGSTKDLSGQVAWSLSSCGSISKSGLVTPSTTVTGSCSATVTAAFGTIAPATTPLTVAEGTPTSILLTPSTTTPTPNTTVTFTAVATFGGKQQDITSSVTWVNSDPTDLTLTNGSGSGTISAGAAVNTQINVTASFAGVNSNTVVLTVQ